MSNDTALLIFQFLSLCILQIFERTASRDLFQTQQALVDLILVEDDLFMCNISFSLPKLYDKGIDNHFLILDVNLLP